MLLALKAFHVRRPAVEISVVEEVPPALEGADREKSGLGGGAWGGEGPSVEQAAHRIQSYTKQIGATAAALEPEERKALFATQRVFSRLAPLMAGYEAALRSLNDSGGSAPATLRSQDEIVRRSGLVKQFMGAARALGQFYGELEKNFGNELVREKLPEPMRKELLMAFRRGASIDENLAIRDCDGEVAASLLELLELLRRHWGGWSVQKEGAVAFEQDAVLGEYLALQGKVRIATERQQKAQKELLERVARTSKRGGSQ